MERVVKESGDFTAEFRLVGISAIAIAIGTVCAVVAFVLLRMIELFTNLFYFHELSLRPHLPASNTLGWLSVLVPVAGGLIIGLMARYGSERIWGHGIPEAMEAILIGQSRMSAKVALLKPISSAISIGSGGPFGAEGPIIMTGGSLGSLIAQAFHLTAAERKTLLVAGAAGGMSATFKIASTVAHGFTVLVMKRSILTEKVARRGYHISREYAVDPLERLSVGEVMATDVVTVAASISIRDLMTRYFLGSGRRHTGYPVVDKAGRLLGVLTRSNFLDYWTDTLLGGGDEIGSGPIIAYDLIDLPVVTACPGESCRVAAERMARAGVKRLPVVAPDDPGRLLGIVSVGDLLRARQRQLDEESRRERFYGPGRTAPGPPTDRA